MDKIYALFQSIMAPKLFRIYHRASSTTFEQQLYVGNAAESFGDSAINYVVPTAAIYCVWTRRWHYFLYLGAIFVTSYLIRAAGRAASPSYQTFLQILARAHKSFNTENAELLRRYDFDFSNWPVSFKSNKVAAAYEDSARELRGVEASTICWLAGWVVAHTIGVRLIYPGVIVSRFVKIPLEEGRSKLVVMMNGIRAKIESSDGNGIDTMFFDRRRMMNFSNFTAVNEINPRGKTLVITFEGNASFYEIGNVATPLDAGYSALAFNHPGFGGSSGTPYPSQELNAAEAVFDYATSVLGFKEEEIVLHAWSIGGFAAAHLASSHPRIKALILDATFDDVLVLALPRMPAIFSSLVRSAVRNHVNLHVSKELKRYAGPIRLFRRTEDEIISDPPGVLTENRGNFLLVDIIRQRYPQLLNNYDAEKAISDWLAKPHVADPSQSDLHAAEPKIPASLDSLTVEEKSRLVIQIADKLMTDYPSSHCTPLPSVYFRMPWVPGGSPVHPNRQVQTLVE